MQTKKGFSLSLLEIGGIFWQSLQCVSNIAPGLETGFIGSYYMRANKRVKKLAICCFPSKPSLLHLDDDIGAKDRCSIPV